LHPQSLVGAGAASSAAKGMIALFAFLQFDDNNLCYDVKTGLPRGRVLVRGNKMVEIKSHDKLSI
jgi:hypothetical protein